MSGIQKGLHRIGRRLGQLRALRVFRDDTDLTASPDLWSRIVDALDRSRFFIVTLSPQAAQSHWVTQEIAYWLQHRGFDQLMLVLVEVLSPSNKAKTWTNVWTYTTLPSVREIVVVHSRRIEVQMLRCSADRTWPDDPDRLQAGDMVRLESIGFQCPIEDIYLLLEHGSPKSVRFFPGGHMGHTPKTMPTIVDWLMAQVS